MLRRRGAVLALLALLSACAGAGDTPREGAPGRGGGPSSFSLSAFDVHAAAPVSPEAAERAKAGILATLDAYLRRAVLAPLGPGGAAGDLAPLFTGPAAGRLSGPDRAALVDEGFGAAEDQPRVSAANVALGLLVGTDGRPVMAGAHLDMRVEAETDQGHLVVDRQGDFALVAEGDPANPVWKVDSYDVRATRGTPVAAATAEGRAP
jgi:hypothetical protein